MDSGVLKRDFDLPLWVLFANALTRKLMCMVFTVAGWRFGLWFRFCFARSTVRLLGITELRRSAFSMKEYKLRLTESCTDYCLWNKGRGPPTLSFCFERWARILGGPRGRTCKIQIE